MSATSPEQLSVLFAKAIQAGDLDAVMALYEPDAVMHNQSGELRPGRDSIRQEMTPFAAMKPDFSINVDKVITSGDIALLHNTWSMSNPDMSGRALEVAHRQPDGTWLYIIDYVVPVGST